MVGIVPPQPTLIAKRRRQKTPAAFLLVWFRVRMPARPPSIESRTAGPPAVMQAGPRSSKMLPTAKISIVSLGVALYQRSLIFTHRDRLGDPPDQNGRAGRGPPAMRGPPSPRWRQGFPTHAAPWPAPGPDGSPRRPERRASPNLVDGGLWTRACGRRLSGPGAGGAMLVDGAGGPKLVDGARGSRRPVPPRAPHSANLGRKPWAKKPSLEAWGTPSH